MKKYIIVLMALAVILLTGCTCGSFVVTGGTEYNSPTEMSMTYHSFTGYKKTSITVKEGTPVEVKVGIVTQSGKLDAYIAKDDDKANAAYEGNDILTSSFTVTLTDPGKYTLRVDGDHHSGSYSFSW